MYESIDAKLKLIAPTSNVVESGTSFAGLPWRSYRRLTFPDFDPRDPTTNTTL
jgi:hypothetical protein